MEQAQVHLRTKTRDKNKNVKATTPKDGRSNFSAAVESQGNEFRPDFSSSLWQNVAEGLDETEAESLKEYWRNTVHHVETHDHDFKKPPFPLKPIMRVIKVDPEVKLVSKEVPVLFAMACHIFITELTRRSWINMKNDIDPRRHTVKYRDIMHARPQSSMYDFLIDIVPEEEESSQPSTTSDGEQDDAQQEIP